MIFNLHGNIDRLGLSKTPHPVATVTTEILGNVSPMFGFASDDETQLAGYIVLKTNIKEEVQVAAGRHVSR